MSDAKPFLKRVLLQEYKSIAAAAVELRRLTFLVGPNGSGKSNFLDALRFTCDSLRSSLDHALRDRGGVAAVRRKSSGHPRNFGIRLDFELGHSHGHYAFLIGSRPPVSFQLQTEQCVIEGEHNARFLVNGGELQEAEVSGARNGVVMPPVPKDRLYLVNAAGLPPFRPVFDALSSMGFYSLNPDRLRDLQSPDSGTLLLRDGSNLTSVLRQLAERYPEKKRRIEEYLATVVPGIRGVAVKDIGPKATLEFRQDIAGAKDAWRFDAANMSDGTLRALGILASLFQSEQASGFHVPLVGIEEPEVALHPAAVGALVDALREASETTQVVVTTHSPELLDTARMNEELVLAVYSTEGVTQIAPVDEASREAVQRGLYTPGELLRMDQLRPDVELFDKATRRLPLFDGVDA